MTDIKEARGLEVVASLHQHFDGRRRVQVPNGVYDQDAGWGAHVEPLVRKSDATAVIDQLRAMLSEQQASRCSDCGYLTSQREHLGCLRKAVAELDAATGGQPQAIAAQSAPAGIAQLEAERDALQSELNEARTSIAHLLIELDELKAPRHGHCNHGQEKTCGRCTAERR